MINLKASYWTCQKTGEPIGPLYSWNDIREMQLEEIMSGMHRKSDKNYTVEPVRTLPLIDE